MSIFSLDKFSPKAAVACLSSSLVVSSTHFRASAGQLQVGHLSLPGHQQGVGAGGPGDHHDYGVVGKFAYLKHKRSF